MIALLQNSKAIMPGRTVPFQGAGGVPDYSYKVLLGGIGGTINAETGLYQAPVDKYGIDTIEVTDDEGSTARAQISVMTAPQLVCDVIQRYMKLTNDQVYLWDQKFTIPTDSRIYIAVSVNSLKAFANNNTFDGEGNALQSSNFYANLSLDIMSRSTLALYRKEEVLMSLMSDYSERQQELNSFRIFPVSGSFVNLSELDGAAIPYRFNISVGIQYFVSKNIPVDYYNDFQEVEVVIDPEEET